MNENIDPRLKNEWEEKLKAYGLPEKIRRQKVPSLTNPTSLEDFLKTLDSECSDLIEKFAKLSKESQKNILTDIKNKKNGQMKPQDLLSRISFLVSKSEEFEKLDVADTDEEYKPKIPEQIEDEAWDRKIREKVDKFIQKMEEKIEEEREFDPNDSGNVQRDIN